MKRITGGSGAKPIECVNPVRNTWRVRWDYQTTTDEETGEETTTYLQEDFFHKPTADEVRDLIWGWVNSKTDEEIREGFSWKGNAVWLSTEHQMNYLAAYQAALASESNLPTYFVFGTDEKPVYYCFEKIDDLQAFIGAMSLYIQSKVSAGWVEKTGYDFSKYTVA